MSEPRRRSRHPPHDAGDRSLAVAAFSSSARGARPGGASPAHPLYHSAFSRLPSPDPDAVVFRLLCPSDRVGALLGADGDALRRLRDETGANIRLLDPEDDPDRVVVLSGAEDGAPLSPAQVALFRAYARLAGDPPSVPFRLLVPRHHLACLLDRDGTVDARIRETTGARVRLLPLDASVDVVEIEGSPALACSAAIRAVSSRLRSAAGAAVEGYGRPVEGSVNRSRPTAGRFLRRFLSRGVPPPRRRRKTSWCTSPFPSRASEKS